MKDAFTQLYLVLLIVLNVGSICVNAQYKEEQYGTQDNHDLYDNPEYVSQGSMPLSISMLGGWLYSEDRDSFVTSNGTVIQPSNTKEVSVDTEDKELTKRLGIAACCQIAIAFGTVVSIPSENLIIDTVKWLYNNGKTSSGRCAAAAFHDAANTKTDWRIKISNTGYCSTTATYKTLYDGVKKILEYFSTKNCRNCCANFSHGGQWRGEIMATTDGSDPWYMDCTEADKYYKCKNNEHNDLSCQSVDSVHDEL